MSYKTELEMDAVFLRNLTALTDKLESEKVMTDKIPLRTRVRKKSGSEWQGRVVGYYSTDLTPNGVCVESDAHAGSVQIYPAAAVEEIGEDSNSNSKRINLTRLGRFSLSKEVPIRNIRQVLDECICLYSESDQDSITYTVFSELLDPVPVGGGIPNYGVAIDTNGSVSFLREGRGELFGYR